MKLNSKLLGIIVLAVIFGGIAISSALGYWNTEGSGGGHGNGAVPISGQPEEESIRGRTTFQDLLAMGLSQETIERVIGGPMPDPLTRVKDHCAANGLDFETVKEALQAEINNLDG
jgi:hypothetical protein